MQWQSRPKAICHLSARRNFVKQSNKSIGQFVRNLYAIDRSHRGALRITNSGHDVKRRDNRESNGNNSDEYEIEIQKPAFCLVVYFLTVSFVIRNYLIIT